MLENKRIYRWFVITNVVFGLGVFVISLVTTLTGSRATLGGQQLYFGREILPDHVFYPVMVVGERLELTLAQPADKILIRQQLARKRLSAAEQLFRLGKRELAWVTLGKAHQYLLQVNDEVDATGSAQEYLGRVIDLNQDFVAEYQALRPFMTDSQLAETTQMCQQLKYAKASSL